MRSKARLAASMVALCALSHGATADVVYLTQDRLITATTSFNGQAQTIVAPGFGPFLESINLSTTFPIPGGGTGLNLAAAGIDCQLDPNAIRVLGSLTGAGGMGLVGGTPTLQFGEARARVSASFHLDAPTPFLLTATPRPGLNPGDRFKMKLENLTNPAVLYFLDQTMPPQTVNFGGSIGPGDFAVEFEVELTVDGSQTLHNFSMNLTVPAPGSALTLALAGLLAARRRR